MAIEKFTFRGLTLDKLKDMPLKEFMKLVPSRQRRSLKRGPTIAQKNFMKKVKKARSELEIGKQPKMIKTHCRDVVITPNMMGLKIGVYNGKEYIEVEITPEKLGHVLGEFTYNRKRVAHSSPGVGATRGSAFVPTK
ncbi:MAG TPA: 30S ribosomal protein S19 [Candidatus Woesearchaeota archaeon]|nr:30S ribosomal protein S19 [Candidatus Woesearchaeota archaeon]